MNICGSDYELSWGGHSKERQLKGTLKYIKDEPLQHLLIWSQTFEALLISPLAGHRHQKIRSYYISWPTKDHSEAECSRQFYSDALTTSRPFHQDGMLSFRVCLKSINYKYLFKLCSWSLTQYYATFSIGTPE